jgi:multisubunit Na+/H+ antiporter MnhB subunit
VPVLAAGLLAIAIGWRPRSADQPILEAFVGLMLVGLGLRVLWRLRHGAAQLHLHRHQHGMRFHSHPHVHFGDERAPVQSHHEIAPTRAPFLVGIVHGLAGSAAFALLYSQTPGAGLSFLAAFGSGTILGMGAMSSLLAVPFFPTARRLESIQIWARGIAGVVSVAFGCYVLFEASWSWVIS